MFLPNAQGSVFFPSQDFVQTVPRQQCSSSVSAFEICPALPREPPFLPRSLPRADVPRLLLNAASLSPRRLVSARTRLCRTFRPVLRRPICPVGQPQAAQGRVATWRAARTGDVAGVTVRSGDVCALHMCVCALSVSGGRCISLFPKTSQNF